MESKKTLRLTLKKQPFEVMITGEKPEEFREDKEWIRSRLLTKNGTRKEYDQVEFTNGYGKTRPRFVAEYLGFEYLAHPDYKIYSNGLRLELSAGMIRIKLGNIISPQH